MSIFRIREAADLMGVSDDTLRRWADSGRVATTTDHAGRKVIEGAVLARFAEELAASTERPEPAPVVSESARNRFVGLVTRVVRDTVMAQVELQAGPFRIVSLMRREAMIATASVIRETAANRNGSWVITLWIGWSKSESARRSNSRARSLSVNMPERRPSPSTNIVAPVRRPGTLVPTSTSRTVSSSLATRHCSSGRI